MFFSKQILIVTYDRVTGHNQWKGYYPQNSSK